jgi:type I restriction enzyme, S subunit
MSSAQVPEGYKQTEIGVIPEDWHVRELGSLGKFKNGINKGSEDFGHGSPFVNLMDVFGVSYISEIGHLGLVNSNDVEKNVYNLKEGDVLFIRSSVKPSGVGLTTVVKKDLTNTVYSGFLIRFRDQNNLKTDYKKYCFSEEKFRQSVISSSTVSANTNINQDNLKKLVIAYPESLDEQQTIAQALSDVDALIASLDKLIAKHRQLKTAAMQQLLTGKMRLSGFGEGKGYKKTEVGVIPEDWIVTEMKNIVENNRISSGVYKEKSLYGNGNQIIKLGDVFNLDYFEPSKSQRVLLEGDELSKYRVNVGDIFIALASVKLEGVGKVMLVTELNEDTAYDHNVALIRVKNLANPKFIFYILKSDFVRSKISKAATQVGTTFLKASTILEFQLPIPIKAEQTEIATVLSDIDTAIAALEKRRAKTQAIKQGMMQELLTGRTRLV